MLASFLLWRRMRGARAFLKGESRCPDLTRRGTPQRFPLHTTPSLRGGRFACGFFVVEEDVGSAGFFCKDIISFLQYLKEKKARI